MYHWAGQKQFPTVITIFSAPNYCDFYNNKGAVIKFKVHLIWYKLEQHIRHSTILIKPASLFTSKFHGFIFLVNSIRGREGYWNIVPFDKTRPEDSIKLDSSNLVDW